MRVIIEADAAAAAATAADFIAALVRRKPDAVLGLATGGTPVSCYQLLIEMHRQEGLDFGQVRTFNLDEYVGLPATHPQSYHRFMQEQLFDHVNLQPERCQLPDGVADDLPAACAAYEAAIREAGGIDLQLLGIGTDGHIAFNEPGSSLAGRTRVKHLTAETIRDNARFFGDEASVPRLAVTMGVGTILEARCCLLLATGAHKAEAVRAAVEGPVSASITASALQLHPDVVMVLDEAAAGELQRSEYYKMAEAAERTRSAAAE
ncbi:glucosamine-6-phosphate deaminase [Candidatus Laterigemmans baculatus]|uniref:glucosamine-6-phosphate deaminase n=1 Tax=Candidatus Laterigemmans baculatus TaxID=2770505 RepID=UPI0013DBC947|nr:glucosamine-6-phosphate deaminase [Candidatus Laterigemmans baculatus]